MALSFHCERMVGPSRFFPPASVCVTSVCPVKGFFAGYFVWGDKWIELARASISLLKNPSNHSFLE